MAEFYQARRLRYEILALIDQRWQIVRVIDDERDALGRPFDRLDFEALERDVTAAAAAALTQSGVSAVRVIRERQRSDGFSTRSEILSRQAPAQPADRNAVVLAPAGAVPLCDAPDDLLGRPACKVIGTMLRPLLDKLGTTAFELVTLEITSQAVTREDVAITTAIGRAARAQAGDDAKKRDEKLTHLVEAARLRVKAAQAARQMPKLGPGGLPALVAELQTRVQPSELKFWMVRSLAVHLKGIGLYGKLEMALDLLAGHDMPVAVEILDEFIACLVDAPSLLKDALGDVADLRSALVLMAQITADRVPAELAADTAPARLAAAMAAGRLPVAYQAIWSRILRTLEGRRRLTRGDLDEEWAALTGLQEGLGDMVPTSWQPGVEAAVTRRMNALREELLER